MSRPEVCVLKFDGINCDEEMAYAFEVTGGTSEVVHVNELRDGSKQLKDYGVLALPGGFSYGDDIHSGQVAANEMTSYLSESLQEFKDDGKPMLGVCNGFQTLTRTGLLPAGELGEQTVTLADNDNARFECRWVELASPPRNISLFVNPEDFEGVTVPMQAAHAEGKLIGARERITRLIADRQVVFEYATPHGTPSDTYPANPNGSMGNIAGLTDPSGLILGMMPHPERSVAGMHPNRGRTTAARQAAEAIFRNIINYAKES
jgi:phosphoribosylformylglycinamidine synthase